MRILFGLLLAALSLSAQDAATEFRAVLDRYRQVTSLQGHFVQTICSEDKGYCQQLEGDFWLSRPALFRFEVTSPERQTVVGDTQVTWFYWPDSNFVRKADAMANPFFEILLGAGADDFRADSLLREETGSLLWLSPTDSFSFLSSLQLGYRQADRAITLVSIDDGSGTRNEYRLSAVKLNPRLPASTFRFKPPREATVEE